MLTHDERVTLRILERARKFIEWGYDNTLDLDEIMTKHGQIIQMSGFRDGAKLPDIPKGSKFSLFSALTYATRLEGEPRMAMNHTGALDELQEVLPDGKELFRFVSDPGWEQGESLALFDKAIGNIRQRADRMTPAR